MFDTIEAALDDLRKGKVVVVCDDKDRENEGDFVALANNITPETVNFMISHGKGLLCMAIAQIYADKLELNPMVKTNTDNYQTAFLTSIDHITNSTGISASDRAVTISKVVEEKSMPHDFRRPGHIFPLLAKPHGVLERAGHTEATVDLAILSGSKPAGVLCEVIKSDGEMARRDDLVLIAKQFGLKIITISDLIDYRKTHDVLVKREAQAQLPTKFGEFSAIGYSESLSDKEHLAVIKGEIAKLNVPLVRIHSECLTGDVFHSVRCDCGEQLDLAMKTINQEGSGIIIYLRQEGRGIGLLNKLRAYELQQQGVDTVDANLQLGFLDDMREYFLAAHILRDLGISKVRVMTNNPAKIAQLEKYGIKVADRVPLKGQIHENNKDYLATKAGRFGHWL